MMLLYGLARDVLRLVLERLEIADLLQLYCSGSPSLSIAIERAAQSSMVFAAQIRFMYGSLPAFAFNIAKSVVRFELRTKSQLAQHPTMTQSAIRALSPHLHTLKLETPEAEEMLRTSDPTELEALRLFNLASAEEHGLSGDPKMLDLSKLFPRLHTLSVVPSVEFSVFRSVDYCVLQSLPLTDLQLLKNPYIDDDIAHYLPTTLKSLGLGPGFSLSVSAAPLPAGLEALSWHLADSGASLTRKVLQRLPQSLTELRTSATTPFLPIHLLQYLPENIQHVHNRAVLLLKPKLKLPIHLKELRIRVKNEFVASLLTSFPPTLRTLFIHIFRATEDTLPCLHSSLPPTLTHYTVFASKVNPAGMVGPLPPNLTKIRHLTGQSLEGKWPESLKRISVTGPSNRQNHPLTLPSGILKLSAGSFVESDLSDLPPTILTLKSLNEMQLHDVILPSALTALVVSGALSITAASIGNLPRSLKKLQVSEILPTGNTHFDFSQCAWPPSLSELSLTNHLGHVVLTAQDLCNLPTSLEIFGFHNAHLPADLLGTLPRNLKELRLNFVTGDFSASIENLPSGLLVLWVDKGAVTAESAARWPRNLESVTLGEFAPVPLLLHYMPHTITRAYLGPENLSLGQIGDYKGPYDPRTRKLWNFLDPDDP